MGAQAYVCAPAAERAEFTLLPLGAFAPLASGGVDLCTSPVAVARDAAADPEAARAAACERAAAVVRAPACENRACSAQRVGRRAPPRSPRTRGHGGGAAWVSRKARGTVALLQWGEGVCGLPALASGLRSHGRLRASVCARAACWALC